MKFLVVLSAQGGKSEDVARFLRAEDAIHFACDLAGRSSPEFAAHVYRTTGRNYNYSLFCTSIRWSKAMTDVEFMDALASHAAKEKKWRHDQRAKKERMNAFRAFRERFETDAYYKSLSEDEAFNAAVFAQPPRFDEAEARAAELGIFPKPTNRVEENAEVSA